MRCDTDDEIDSTSSSFLLYLYINVGSKYNDIIAQETQGSMSRDFMRYSMMNIKLVYSAYYLEAFLSDVVCGDFCWYYVVAESQYNDSTCSDVPP